MRYDQYFLCFLVALTAVFYACNSDEPVDNMPAMRSVPLVSEITEVQPMTGIVYWTTNPQNNTDAISLEYSYLLYSDIVSQKGQYDWSAFEALLDDVASRQHQAVVRFRYVYVGDRESAVPAYIRALPGYEKTIGISEGRETCFPDWRNEELKRFHLEFYREFAERYDDDPRVAFLQTGFGLWAEYHIYDGPREIGRTFPSKDFQETFFHLMDASFKELPWNISIDAANPEYTPFAAKPELKQLAFGLFDDSFMHEDHDGYNTESWNFFGRDRYMSSPAGGEFSYYSDFDQEHVLDREGMHGRIFEDEAREFHISYMIGNDQPRYQSTARIKEAGMACGYRFEVTEFRTMGDSSVVCVANTGTAPIYRDAYISVNGLRSDISLKSLLPGKSECFELSSGGDNPQLAIECDHLVEGQKIQFAANIKAE